MERRDFLKTTVLVGASSFLPTATADPVLEGLTSSDLIYLTPIKTNGKESACQAEIWFVYDGASTYVCTGTSSWRATAPQKGLTRTRVWVGDLGQWKETNGKYKQLPSFEAKTSIEADPAEHERILELFGDKYPMSWIVWGPRFKKGLKDNSRTLIKYQRVT